MDESELQKPTSPPPGTPTMSTFNPERQVSVITDDHGSGGEPDSESPTSPTEDTPTPEGGDEDIQPVPDFPPPPPPDMTSEASEGVSTGATEDPPPVEISIDEDPPAEEMQPSPPDVVVVDVHDGEPQSDAEPTNSDITQDGPGDSGEEAEEDEEEAEYDGYALVNEPPDTVNNVHPSGNVPLYRTSTKQRYVQHEIPEEEKEHNSILCWCCVVLFTALSVGAFLVAVVWITFFATDSDTIDVIEVDGDLLSADIRVTLNRTFSVKLYEPSSLEYGQLEEEYVTSIGSIMQETDFADDLFGTVVTGFRPGSVVVFSMLYFKPDTDSDALRNSLADEILENSKSAPALLVTGVELEEVRTTPEDGIKIPIRIFTKPPTTPMSSSTASPSTDLPDMTTLE